MLTRFRVLASVLVLAVVTIGVAPGVASADDSIYCPPLQGACEIVAETPGGPGGGGGTPGGGGGSGGGEGRCLHEQLGDVACHHRSFGWFNPTDACYYEQLDLPADDPAWKGQDPASGDLYRVWCWDGMSAGWQPTRTVYLTGPPPGYGGMPSPVTLALRAINQLGLTGPDIHTAPSVDGVGLVGLPVWLWTPTTATTWGPATAVASVPGMSVIATAHAARIEWRMGDGYAVTCANPGTPYSAGFGGKPSPTCGYIYGQSSRHQPGGKFTVTAVTTWHVTWVGGGQSGALDVTRQSTSTLQIQELQVVTR